MTPFRKIEALVARDPELKADAQRAFVAYIKSVYLMKNKEIFNVEALKFDRYAASLGLAVTPRIRFLKDKIKARSDGGDEKKFQGIPKTKSRESGDESDTVTPGEEAKEFNINAVEDDDFLTMKRRDHDLPAGLIEPEPQTEETRKGKKKKALTKAAIAKKMLKKNIVANKKTVFTDDGQMVEQQGKEKFSEEARAYDNEDVAGIDIAKAKKILRAEDKFDKKLFRERVKLKHKEQKKKLKQAKGEEEDVRLASGSEEDDDGSEPDTSWIPDPDKFYGKEGSDESEESSIEEPEEQLKPNRKRKKLVKTFGTKKKKSLNDFDTGLSLAEDEEIALRVLQSSRK